MRKSPREYRCADGPFRCLPFLLIIDAVSDSFRPGDGVASSGFFDLLTLATFGVTVCPDGPGSSTSPPCSDELDDDDDTSPRVAFGVGPPNIWIQCSRGTDKRPEIDSGYREMTLAGFIFNLTKESSARSNSHERNCDTASSALARLVRLSFNDAGHQQEVICRLVYTYFIWKEDFIDGIEEGESFGILSSIYELVNLLTPQLHAKTPYRTAL